MTTAKDIYNFIDGIAPFNTMEEWDNAGFLIGDINTPLTKVVLALDATPTVIRRAKDLGAEMVLSHHPIIFGSIRNVMTGTAVYTAVENGVAVLSAHTNFDKAKGGISDNLAKRLKLKNIHQIGDTYVYAGELENEMNVHDFARFVSKKLAVSGIRYTKTDKKIKTVAVGGGSCDEYAALAFENADAFVTGEVKHHIYLEWAEKEKPIFSAGHFETESDSFKMLTEKLQAEFPTVQFIWGEQENPVLALD